MHYKNISLDVINSSEEISILLNHVALTICQGHCLKHLICNSSFNIPRYCYYPHFTDGETKVQT